MAIRKGESKCTGLPHPLPDASYQPAHPFWVTPIHFGLRPSSQVVYGQLECSMTRTDSDVVEWDLCGIGYHFNPAIPNSFCAKDYHHHEPSPKSYDPHLYPYTPRCWIDKIRTRRTLSSSLHPSSKLTAERCITSLYVSGRRRSGQTEGSSRHGL